MSAVVQHGFEPLQRRHSVQVQRQHSADIATSREPSCRPHLIVRNLALQSTLLRLFDEIHIKLTITRKSGNNLATTTLLIMQIHFPAVCRRFTNILLSNC